MIPVHVITEYAPPPGPSTAYDWMAFVAGTEEPTGRGPTETEALRDLSVKLFTLTLMAGACAAP